MGDLKISIPSINSAFFIRLSLVLFAISLVGLKAYGSPHPGMGTSALVAPEHGLFFKREGFSLKTNESHWVLAIPSEQITFLNPESPSGTLSVRTDTLRSEITLESYAKRWMKDYSSYGFDLLGTKAFGQNKIRGLVIDLDHKKSGQQLRQILFIKNKKVVILTCKDKVSQFKNTLQGCNQITKSFEWSDLIPQKSF